MTDSTTPTRDQLLKIDEALVDDSEYFEEVLEEFYDEHERYPGTDELIRWHRQYFQAHTIVLPPEFFEARGLEVRDGGGIFVKATGKPLGAR